MVGIGSTRWSSPLINHNLLSGRYLSAHDLGCRCSMTLLLLFLAELLFGTDLLIVGLDRYTDLPLDLGL